MHATAHAVSNALHLNNCHADKLWRAMTPHDERLLLLTRALHLPDPTYVVPRLRALNVTYVGSKGEVLFADGPEWSDEQLVEAAVKVFIGEDLESSAHGLL